MKRFETSTSEKRFLNFDEFEFDIDLIGKQVGYLNENHLEDNQNKEDQMIRASRKANLTRDELIEAFKSKGLIGVYNLGQRYMLEYLEDEYSGMSR